MPTSTIELRPGERFRLLFRDSDVEIVQAGAGPLRFAATAAVRVYYAPVEGAAWFSATPRVLDVYEQRGEWWRVTQPPARELWVRARGTLA